MNHKTQKVKRESDILWKELDIAKKTIEDYESNSKPSWNDYKQLIDKNVEMRSAGLELTDKVAILLKENNNLKIVNDTFKQELDQAKQEIETLKNKQKESCQAMKEIDQLRRHEHDQAIKRIQDAQNELDIQVQRNRMMRDEVHSIQNELEKRKNEIDQLKNQEMICQENKCQEHIEKDTPSDSGFE